MSIYFGNLLLDITQGYKITLITTACVFTQRLDENEVAAAPCELPVSLAELSSA